MIVVSENEEAIFRTEKKWEKINFPRHRNPQIETLSTIIFSEKVHDNKLVFILLE